MTEQKQIVKSILLIMPEAMVKKYRRLFLHEGFICKAVDSGFYALTMLEREKPSLIIATEDIEDLEVHDLLEIIEIDPDLSGTSIIVLSENVDAESNDRCMSLSRDSEFKDILATANDLLEKNGSFVLEEVLEKDNKAEEVEEPVQVGRYSATRSDSDASTIDEAIIDDDNDEKQTNDIIVDEISGDVLLSTATPDSNLETKISLGDTENSDVESSLNVASLNAGDLNDIQDNTQTPADIRYDVSDAQISGDLATDQLIELIKTFAMGSRGLLIVRTSKADGRLLLEQNRLLKAEYNFNQGKHAFDALLYDALNEHKVSYYFKRYDTASSNKGSNGKGVALNYLFKTSRYLVET